MGMPQGSVATKGGPAAKVGVMRAVALPDGSHASETGTGAGKGEPHGSVGGACWDRGMPQGSFGAVLRLELLMSSRLGWVCGCKGIKWKLTLNCIKANTSLN